MLRQPVRTLVLGGGGFIGTHLVNLMVNTGGREISVLGRAPAPRFLLPPEVKYISGNLGDQALLSEILSDIDELIYLAYATVPTTSFLDPVDDLLVNVPAAVSLFREAVTANLSKVLLVSSGGTVYGNANYLPIDEGHPTNPVSPYGITKLAIEKYARFFYETAGLPIMVARPANPFGPLQLVSRGQGFVAAAVSATLAGEKVRIYGPQGTIRDYIYIDDLARGLLAVLNFGAFGEIYNIGTGVGLSNLEVINVLDSIARCSGLKVEYEIHPVRAFDVVANVLDSARLTQLSGWNPKFEFSVGLAETWSWASRVAARN